MSVKIMSEICICCGNCLRECPTNSIVDNFDNPEQNSVDSYYVYENKCNECQNFSLKPSCALACPIEDCIVWSINLEPIFKKEGDLKNVDINI